MSASDDFFQPDFAYGPRPVGRPVAGGVQHVVTRNVATFLTAVIVATAPCAAASEAVIRTPAAVRERVAAAPVFAQIERIEKLKPGWDSYGGAPPSAETIAAARRFALALGLAEGLNGSVPEPTVQVGGDGVVGFVWSDASRKRLLDVEVHPGKPFEYVLSGPGQYEEGAVKTVDSLLTLIAALG